MELETDQQSAAVSAETLPEAATGAEHGEPGAPQETEEQVKEREAAEAAEKARVKEERRQASVQKRINELTAEKYANQKLAEQLAEQNKRMLEILEGKSNPKSNDGEPKREDFQDYEEFVTARAEWRAEQRAIKLVEERLKAQEETQTKRERETAEKAVERQFLERRAAAEKELPDFREVVSEWEPKVPDSVVDMILRMPDGPLISYHMAKNPALEAQFRDQPAYMHGILLGQLSATLKSPPKVTAAPTPGKPVSAGKPGSSTEPPSNPELYYEWAKKHLR